MSERWRVRYLMPLVGILTALALVGIPTAGAAQTTSAPCASGPGSFSVLFLIDQSNSMSGTTIDGTRIPASDPTGLRPYAPGFALSWIMHHPRLTSASPTDVLGEVDFGQTAAVDLPLTAVASNQFGPAAEAEQQRLASAFRLEKRGDTDPRPAFDAAAAQFEQQAQACGDQVGQRALILVTDGGPCVVADGCDPSAPYWTGDRAYLEQLIGAVQTTFDPDSYRLWVLTLARPDAVDLERVLPQWNELARRYRGGVIAVRHDPVDLQEQVDSILDELSRVPVTPTSSPTPAPSASPTPRPSTPTPLVTPTPVVPPPTPTPSPPPSPPAPGRLALIVGAILVALAALGALVSYLLATYRPRGSLAFVGAANREERGRLTFTGWSPVTYLDAADCVRLLPLTGITSLTARAGPLIGGRTTIDLAMIGADGHIVNHRFDDTDADYVNDRHDDEVVYEATRVLPSLSNLLPRAIARPGHAFKLALIPWAVLMLAVLTASVAQASAPVAVLDVPYVSQLDGSPYAGSNCGPASLTMVLRAYGIATSEGEARAAVNRLQGTSAYDSGTALETIATIVQRHGLDPVGLMAGSHHARWTRESLLREIQAGHPVIPEVRYRRLPGHGNAAFDGDHYVVLIGVQGDQVIYQDPAFSGDVGVDRRVSMEGLLQAMAASEFPYAAVAVAPGSGKLALKQRAGTSIVERQPTKRLAAATGPSTRATPAATPPPPAVTAVPKPVISQPPPAPAAAALTRPVSTPTEITRSAPEALAVGASSAPVDSPLIISVTISAPRLPNPSTLLTGLVARPPALGGLRVVSLPRIALPSAPTLDLSAPLTWLRSHVSAGEKLARGLPARVRSTATEASGAVSLPRAPVLPAPALPIGLGLGMLLIVPLGLVGAQRLEDRSRGLTGTLVFVDAASQTVLGQVRLTEQRRSVRWGLSRCTERLPAVGLKLLQVERGPIFESKTTIKLTLVGPDEHAVMRLFHDRDVAALDDLAARQVIYRAEAASRGNATTRSALIDSDPAGSYHTGWRAYGD